MSYPQYYKTLGVSIDASPEKIREAYYKLVKKYHPDTHKGDKKAEERLKVINAAYDVLKDFSKRAEYDYRGKTAAANAVNKADDNAESKKQSTSQTESAAVSDELRKFARKQRIKWIVNKLILVSFFVAYMFFLRAQANPEKPYDLITTLHNSSLTFRRAVQNGAEYAVSKAKDIYHNEHWRAKALSFAVKHNCKSMLEFLLQYCSANTIDETSGESLLMVADDAEVAKLLLKHGADVNYVSKKGNTALLAAVKRNNAVLVEILLQAGANPSFVAPNGDSLIKIAALQNAAKIVSLLVKYKINMPLYKI